MGPAMSDPGAADAPGVERVTDEVERAEGGRGTCGWAEGAAMRPFSEVEDGCRTGEKVDCAELGRSGILFVVC